VGSQVLQTEARITMIDGILASTLLVGLVLKAAARWWWADPLGFVLVYYAIREGRGSLSKP